MKKIIWLINQYATTPETGIGGRSYYLACELAKQGHCVYLIAASYSHMMRTSKEIKNKFEVETVHGFNLVRVKTFFYPHSRSKKRILNWFLFSWRLRELKNVIKERPDIILYSSPSPIGFWGAKYLARKLQSKLIFEVRDIWPLTLMELGGYSVGHPFIKLLQYIEDVAYKDSDYIISNLKYAYEHMVKRGMKKEKFHWIPNGFSLDEAFDSDPLPSEIKLKLPKDKFIIGYTGSIGLANEINTVIKACEILNKGKNNIVFVLVGRGSELRALKEIVFEKKLENVIFIDSIPKLQIQSIIQEFDVCFIGLKKSNLFYYGVSPNKLFDYLYAAKPIIYAIDSGKYRPVSEADCGIEIDPQNPNELAKAAILLSEMSPNERRAMGERGRSLAMQDYEYGKIAQRFTSLFLS